MAKFKYIPNRVIDTNGISDGASIAVYQSGTTTPVSIYSDEALTTPLANPYSVPAGAAVPELFFSGPANGVRVKVLADDGATISDDDPYQPPLSSADLSGDDGASLVGTATTETTQQVLDRLDSGVTDISGDLAIVASRPEGSLTYREPDPLSVVQAPSTANIADPETVDVAGGSDTAPPITDAASMLYRIRNNGNGNLGAQSSSSFGTFAVLPKYTGPADAGGKQFTMHIHRAPTGWLIRSADSTINRLQFFNTDGSFHSEVTTFTRDSATRPREITFTWPVGAEKFSPTMRNLDYSNTNPIPVEEMQTLLESVMLTEGGAGVPFTPYSDGSFTVSADRFDVPEDTKPILVERQGKYFYIRQPAQMHATKDVVWRLFLRGTSSYSSVNSKSGVLDFYGQRFVPKTATDAIASFNQSTDRHNLGIDESAATKTRSMYRNGQHGSTIYEITVASHDKTNVDVGALFSDGVDTWMLISVVSATKLAMQRRYTGDDLDWLISSAAPASNTFTHVSGATHTNNIAGTASAQSMFVPIISEYTTQAEADGTEITTDGAYRCDHFVIHESWKGLNPAKVQDDLIANVGASSPDWTPDVAMEVLYYRHEWDEFGAYSCPLSYRIVEGYTRRTDDYYPGIQLQRPSLSIDSDGGMHNRVDLLIHDVGTVGGYNFKAGANLTSNSGQIDILTTDCDDPANPASLFCWLGYSGSNIVSGQLFGYDPTVGLGDPAVRASSVDTVLTISAFEKCYPHMIDVAVSEANEGEAAKAVPFRIPYLPTDSHLKVPGVCVRAQGKILCFIVTHEALTNYEVAVPMSLSGLPVTLIDGVGASLISAYVSNGKIKITTTGTSGSPSCLKLQIGPTP